MIGAKAVAAEAAPSTNRPEILFRYVDQRDSIGGASVILLHMKVLRYTTHGFWVWDDWKWRERFVLADATKAYAYADLDEALTSYIKRKERQIKLLSGQLAQARDAVMQARNRIAKNRDKMLNSTAASFQSDDIFPPRKPTS